MIYLDTNVFIYAATNDDEKGNWARQILKTIIEEKEQGYTSCLTWDEVVHALWKLRGKEKAHIEGRKMLELGNIHFLPPTINIINKAQDLIEQTSLKPRDAIHAATAIVKGISNFATNDDDFDEVKELKRLKPS